MSKLSKSFKGQISKETEKAIEITVIKGDELFSTWLPKSALNMKEMPVDCLSKEGVQIFHVHQWFLDLKAKEKPADESTKAEEYETRTLSKDTTTVDMPFNPDKIESDYIYYPEFDHPSLRKMHAKEKVGGVRGHIENVILRKQIRDAIIENTKATIRVGDLLEAMKK